jgi:5-methylcytosine-specific restriction endonuclease McrA
MQKGQFLDNTACQVCDRPADKIDMKKEKDQITGAFIYYCDMGVKEKSDNYCCWYCKPCFEKEAMKEMEAIKVINGGSSHRRYCRVPSVGV